jgi:hypothetical protein
MHYNQRENNESKFNWCKFRKSLQRLAIEICKGCKNTKCKFSPNYRERVSGRSEPKRDLLICDFIDDVKPIRGIKAGKKGRKS